MVATCKSELDIINTALQYLGSSRQISTSDKTNEVTEMQNAYRLTRDNLIRSYNWNCCIKEDTAAFIEKIEGADRPFVYSVPSDCLKLISLNGLATGYSGVERVERHNPMWKIRGQKIYTKLSYPLPIEYCYRNEDVMSYDASFCKVLALDLAIAVCERITQSSSKQEELLLLRKMALTDALRANSLELPATPKITGNWLKSRDLTEAY